MSNTVLRHQRVLKLHKHTRPNPKRKAYAREARERREAATVAALARLEESGIIGQGSVE